MAGAGFKDFTVGEVLTSADVDQYLMQQSVMRFPSSAARGSALGTAVGTGTALAEGMVTYLDDTDVVEVYSGTGWIRVVAPSGAAPKERSLLAYGTATAKYTPAVEIAAGTATISSTTTITFPSGRFTNAPVVTAITTNSETFAGLNGTTTASQFVIISRNFEGTIVTVGINWMAIGGAG